MAMASLVRSPCSSSTLNSSRCSTSRNYAYQHIQTDSMMPMRQPTALILGTNFVDSLGCRRLTRKAGLHGESSNTLHRRKPGFARAALPVISSIPVLGPVMNAVFNPVVLMIIYLAGASRFWSGFNRTTYTNATPTKVALTALWPALYVASQAYRANFKKAVL